MRGLGLSYKPCFFFSFMVWRILRFWMAKNGPKRGLELSGPPHHISLLLGCRFCVYIGVSRVAHLMLLKRENLTKKNSGKVVGLHPPACMIC